MHATRSQEAQLVSLLRANEWLMRALRAARDVDAPDWLIGAGAIRGVVWDRLHGIEHPAPPKDVDLVFFDPDALGEEREGGIRDELRKRAPELDWDVKNQAAVHLWFAEVFGYEVRPLTSSADAIATWPEVATAVAVRLLSDDKFEIVAPLGLDDLLGLVWRHNPRRATSALFRQRLREKRILERWPRVTVVT
jgi:uncharacterized protein